MDTPTTLPPAVFAVLALAAVATLVLLAVRAHRARYRDPQRLFTWEQKKVLIRQAGGRCEHKHPLWFRCPMRGDHADHIHPWSKGGPTELDNGQLLCREHNRAKSAHIPSPLYRWRLMQRRKRYDPPSWGIWSSKP